MPSGVYERNLFNRNGRKPKPPPSAVCKQCGGTFFYKRYGEYRSDGDRRVWKMQHRVVMEEYLGRKLRPDETVHHINGNRADNRLENLELWSSRHGKGQRVEDKIKFCREFLADYEPRQASVTPIVVSEIVQGYLSI